MHVICYKKLLTERLFTSSEGSYSLPSPFQMSLFPVQEFMNVCCFSLLLCQNNHNIGTSQEGRFLHFFNHWILIIYLTICSFNRGTVFWCHFVFKYSPEYVVHSYNQYEKTDIKSKYKFSWASKHWITGIWKLLKSISLIPWKLHSCIFMHSMINF